VGAAGDNTASVESSEWWILASATAIIVITVCPKSVPCVDDGFVSEEIHE
jgi:hypothetical protein